MPHEAMKNDITTMVNKIIAIFFVFILIFACYIPSAHRFIYYLIQNALEYLYKSKALQARNENFINTNLLKKTLQQYREKSLTEKWETSTLPRPNNIPFSRMSEILLFKFLGYDESIFFHPIRHAWKRIEPRLNFYSQKRCMHCGSSDLTVEYDANDYVSLLCRNCKHQDHYFTR